MEVIVSPFSQPSKLPREREKVVEDGREGGCSPPEQKIPVCKGREPQ